MLKKARERRRGLATAKIRFFQGYRIIGITPCPASSSDLG
jgi:hypothetical protein